MQHTNSATDHDTVEIGSTFAPLVTRSNVGQRRGRTKERAAEEIGYWLWRGREGRHLATPGGSETGDRVLPPDLPDDKPRPCRPHEDSERGCWIGIGILTVLGIAFLIFAILNPELIATTFGTY